MAIELSFEQMKTISLVLYGGAGLMFLVTVLLFFMFHIPQVIGFLTGTQERKGVAALRKEGVASLESAHNVSPMKKRKGKAGAKFSSRDAKAVAAQQVTTEKIRTEELLEEVRSKHEPAFAPSPMAQGAPSPSAPPPGAQAETQLLSSDLPQTAQAETQLLSPEPPRAAHGETQPLSPAMSSEQEPAGFDIAIQPEFELYFYASAIHVG